MKLRSISIISCCAVAFAFGLMLNASAQEPVRPAGMLQAVAKPSPAQVAATQSEKKKPARRKTVRKTPKPLDTSETSPLVSRDVPATGARAVMIVDAHSGQVLYEKNADEVRQAASTQKLLTALIVAERGYLDRPVRVEAIDAMCEPVKLNIRPGDTYQRIDLLRALLVKSPNDVARCLARDSAGSVEAFAASMNQRARALGATQSHFVNPNGLPVPGQYSSARDLSLIARAAYANPTIRSIVCLPKLVFCYANGRTRELENSKKLPRRLPYCNGMNPGSTDPAGKGLSARGMLRGRAATVDVLGSSSSDAARHGPS